MQQLVSVIAVIQYNNTFLLVQRHPDDAIFPGKWQNLGGKVEPGERLEEALRREIKEEVGITIPKKQTPRFVQSYSWKKNDTDPYRLGIIFLFEFTKKPKVTINDELANYGWFTMKEAKKLDTIGKTSPTGTLGQLKKTLA